MPMSGDLTPRQAAFVAAYIETGNATQSAIAAGYSPKNADVQGPRLLGYVGIQDALRQAGATALQRVQRAEEAAVGTAEWIIRNAVETHQEARSDGQYGPAVAALNLLAKRFPEFRETQQQPSQELHLHGLSDEQLNAFIAAIASKQLPEGGA